MSLYLALLFITCVVVIDACDLGVKEEDNLDPYYGREARI